MHDNHDPWRGTFDVTAQIDRSPESRARPLAAAVRTG
jgi:hypothetical protein